MAALSSSRAWVILCCKHRLVAVDRQTDREPFVFDCSSAEKNPEKTDNQSDAGSEDTGSDQILAFAFSPSGRFAALTDDNKRLVLFRCEPDWQPISTRWVARRCTSLVFSQSEAELLVADKSGDVYSFSVKEPERCAELKLGHLSMLLDLTLSPDGRFIITADRDEKIRVSHLKCPYNIQSFCLGHQEFVSCLLIPEGRPHRLLSGSGDGTVKLWDYESGRQLDSWDVNEQQKRSAVSKICCSPDGRHIAALLERASTVQILGPDQAQGQPEDRLCLQETLTLSQPMLDVAFDPQGRLWLLVNDREHTVQVYAHTQQGWQVDTGAEVKRVKTRLEPFCEDLQASQEQQGCFQKLYKGNLDNMEAYLQKKRQRVDALGNPGTKRRPLDQSQDGKDN